MAAPVVIEPEEERVRRNNKKSMRTVEMWPENKSEDCQIISKYGGLGKEREKNKHKIFNLVWFLESKKKKLEKKSNKKNMKMKNFAGCV
ncbi:hypothetical protein QYF36_013294 [Acer negundo]|nr:hypothetical protein QYF36_013294 [Acer negundo]